MGERKRAGGGLQSAQLVRREGHLLDPAVKFEGPARRLAPALAGRRTPCGAASDYLMAQVAAGVKKDGKQIDDCQWGGGGAYGS